MMTLLSFLLFKYIYCFGDIRMLHVYLDMLSKFYDNNE